MLDARKQTTCKFWTFLSSHGPRPNDLTAHTLNKGTKRRADASATYYAALVGLKILQTMPKTCPHQESFEKMCVGDNFLPNRTVLGGRRAESRPRFSEYP